jgi:type IV pilus assembly protein PilE
MRKKLNSKGFTLIELLIVIIIIGILAAIAFVAYSGSQNKAHKADAQSTLSEVRNKLGEYNADNGYYPASISDFDTWLASSSGGNSTLAAKFVGSDYTYAGTPANCDNGSGGDCTGYTATAAATIWGDSNTADNITVTN